MGLVTGSNNDETPSKKIILLKMNTNIVKNKITIKSEIMEENEIIYVKKRETTIRGSEYLLDPLTKRKLMKRLKTH